MGSLTILLMNKLNVWVKMLTNKINTVLLHSVNKHISNIFTVTKYTTIINQMKKYQKHWFIETYPPLILIKNKTSYNKFKTSNLVIKNNSSSLIGVLQKKKKKTTIIYQFKCSLGDCIFENNNNIYVGLTSTTLSRRLTMHLSDTSSIAQH